MEKRHRHRIGNAETLQLLGIRANKQTVRTTNVMMMLDRTTVAIVMIALFAIGVLLLLAARICDLRAFHIRAATQGKPTGSHAGEHAKSQ